MTGEITETRYSGEFDLTGCAVCRRGYTIIDGCSCQSYGKTHGFPQIIIMQDTGPCSAWRPGDYGICEGLAQDVAGSGYENSGLFVIYTDGSGIKYIVNSKSFKRAEV